MKVIFCAADMGLSDAYNVGVLKAIDDGVVSSVEVITGMSGTENALYEMKKRPWVTLIWRPCTDGASDSLYQRLCGEVEECIRIYGNAPFAAAIEEGSANSDIAKAVCDEYGILHDYLTENGGEFNIARYTAPNEQGLSFEEYTQYDPLKTITEIPDSESVMLVTMHPGFLDESTLALLLKTNESTMNVHRLKDVLVLCSEELKNLIADREIEVVSLADVVRMRNDYQNKIKTDGWLAANR